MNNIKSQCECIPSSFNSPWLKCRHKIELLSFCSFVFSHPFLCASHSPTAFITSFYGNLFVNSIARHCLFTWSAWIFLWHFTVTSNEKLCKVKSQRRQRIIKMWTTENVWNQIKYMFSYIMFALDFASCHIFAMVFFPLALKPKLISLTRFMWTTLFNHTHRWRWMHTQTEIK